MSKNEKRSSIPNPPKSIGLSRRLVIALVTILLSVMGLFLMFLTHYSPKEMMKKPSYGSVPINQEDSSAQIAKIEKAVHRPALVNVNSTTRSGTTAGSISRVTPESEWGLRSDNAFRQGSNANISVYHNPAAERMVSNTDSSLVNKRDHYLNLLSGIRAPDFDPYKAQNKQSEKTAFLKQSHQKSENLIESTLQKLLSRYEINAGTIIPATLMTGINSTLPGTLIAKVRRDVFDTVSGNYLLIPQGTTLLGQYDFQVAYGQSRVLIVWSRLVFPNGSSFDLQGMPGADLTGMAGLHDQVNNHYFHLFGSALMFSLFGAAGQLSQAQHDSGQLSAQQILYAAVGQQMGQTAMQFIAKNMNIQPTIKVRPGTNFNVLLTRDMVLPNPYSLQRR